MKKQLFLFLFTIIIASACINQNEELEFNTNYEAVIEVSEEIPAFSHPTADDSLISYLHTRSNGTDFVAFDRVDRNFKRFDENYEYIKSHGNMGRGPLEFTRFSSFELADNGKFYLFDPGSRKMIVYGENDDESIEFGIEEEIISIAVDKNGNILVYYLVAGKETVLSLYDKEGNLIKDFFTPDDQNFKTFIYMFRNGNVAYSSENDRFYFLYPDSFDLYEIDATGQITDTLQFTGRSKFMGEVPAFPEYLDPFGMSDEHREYLMSFIQPARFYLLEDGNVLFKNTRLEGPETYVQSYNVINMDGTPVFEGIVFPEELDAQLTDNFKDGQVLMNINDTLRKVRFKQ